jgi:hypothetical protein
LAVVWPRDPRVNNEGSAALQPIGHGGITMFNPSLHRPRDEKGAAIAAVLLSQAALISEVARRASQTSLHGIYSASLGGKRCANTS